MNISIIICTHNRARSLRDVLYSICETEVPEGCTAEVIVVDNASTDNTKSVIDEFSKYKKFSLKTLFESRLGKTYALNKAIDNASGEVLAFIDDDHIINRGYLDVIYKTVKENPLYNLFCGRVLPNWTGTEPQWVHDDTVYPIRPFPIPCFDLGDKKVEIKLEKEGVFMPGAGNLVIRKNVFHRIGYFSEHLGPKGHNLAGGEDIEFIKRALKSGEKILYVPDIVQYHQVNQSKLTLVYIIKKAYLRSKATYQFLYHEDGNHNVNGIPRYLLRQAVDRFVRALFSVNKNARRYYLVRLAAVLGEIQGRLKSNKIRKAHNEKIMPS